MSHFEKYSAYYDVLYQDKDYQSEADYIFDILNKNHAKLSSLIEFGSGSGIHAELLAKNGLHVDGIDLSENMVRESLARKEASIFKNQLTFQTGDIREKNLQKKSDAVVSLFHVVSYLTQDHDVMAAFKNARAHLNPDGLFFFDFWYKPAVLHFVPEYREKTMENNKYHVFRKSIPEHLPQENKVNVRFEVEVTDKLSGAKEFLKETHPMRYFDIAEIEIFLNQCGFELVHSYEWLTKNRPTQKSWGVAVLARVL